MFEVAREAFACQRIPQQSVCCSQRFLGSQ
jgi:hypothetical protein